MKDPEYISINAVDTQLNRHPHTILRWCAELSIPIEYRSFHLGTSKYIHRADFERLREFNASQPNRLAQSRPRRRMRSAEVPDRPDWRLGIRDREIRRRIEAASAWKRANYGAYIGTVEMSIIEHYL